MTTPSAVVVGAGGIGLFVQHLLQQTGESVLVARDASAAALRAHGLLVTGRVEASVPIEVRTWGELAPFPAGTTVLVATKANELPEVLSRLRPLLGESTDVVLCQNGIGIADVARSALPGVPVHRLLCWMGVARRELHHLHVAGVFRFDLGSPSPDFSRVLRDRLAGASPSVPVVLSSDLDLAEWRKALWNIAVNGLCAVVQEKNGAILDDPGLRAIAGTLLDEAFGAARAAGILLDEDDRAAVFRSLETTRENVNATLQDLRAGREPELDYLNGAVVRAALSHGLTAPVNETILGLVSHLARTAKLKEVRP